MTRGMRMAIAAMLGLLLLAVPVAGAADKPDKDKLKDKAKTTEIQILGLNDFHGNLEPPTGSGGRIGGTEAAGNAGGVEYLATHVRALRATNPNTIFVSAGDLIGATPLISALFHDEPSIEAFNLMELDYNGVGNHEFDEGVDELLRMQNGGCHPVDGCQDGDPFEGAEFGFLAANVKYKSSGETIFPPYAIHKFPGLKIAVVGMTLEGTPSIVSPAGISQVDFFDEADSVNALVPELKKKNIETIIVLLHEGGNVTDPLGPTTINSCTNPTGPVLDVVDRMDPEIDVVVTGHTNWAVNCVRPDGKVMTGAAAFGRLVTDIDLTIDRKTNDVIRERTKVNNVIVTRTVEKAADLTALVDKYRTLSAPIANRVIGSITASILRAQNPAGESALGDVIADAQLDATDDPGFGDAVAAFMNPGGIRGDLTFAGSAAGEGDGNVTYGEAFTVQPFGNSLVTMTLTGAQIDRLLEEQFAGCTFASNRILQVSVGFAYTWSAGGAPCDKVNPAFTTIDGIPVNALTSYRITVNSFLAEGGDSFPILVSGTNRLGGAVDTDALEDYFTANSPLAPGPQNRITQVP